MRFAFPPYARWPKTEAPSLLPIGQGAWQPPGVVRVA